METTLTTNFAPEKEVIELTEVEKLCKIMEELANAKVDEHGNIIPAKEEEPEKKDEPTVH